MKALSTILTERATEPARDGGVGPVIPIGW